MGFTRVEVITSMAKLDSLQKTVSKFGVTGMTVFQVLGCGVQKGAQEYEVEERKDPVLLPKQMIMMIVDDAILDKLIDAIEKDLYTGHIGDGKIFLSEVKNVIRIRTGEDGAKALE